jgi:high-affinity nickel-transport protein
MAFVLGLRHGLDADHLAAIDGVTRCNASSKHRFAPWCGVLFSAGHSGVILFVAMAMAVLAGRWDPPDWLAPTGTVISAGTLLLLGLMNLRGALTAQPNASSAPTGLRSRLFAPILRAPGPWQVALVGALFAVSFDAVAIATLFAASTSLVSGVIGVALAFAGGMLTVGAANGFWVVRLLRHSGDSSRIASRVMTLTIGVVALLVSVCVLLPTFFESIGRWVDAYELVVSALVVTGVLAGYVLSLFVANRARAGQSAAIPGAREITPDILSR